MNSVLPPPLFKYRSNTYYVLLLAKFFNGPFTKQEMIDLRYEGRLKSKKDGSDNNERLRKSLNVLVKNGSLERISNVYWQITDKGRQQVRDFATRNMNKGD